MPYCRDCGKSVSETARFCEECGSAQPLLAAPEAEEPPSAEQAAARGAGRGWYVSGWVLAGLYGIWLILGVRLQRISPFPGSLLDVLLQPILWAALICFAVASAKSKTAGLRSWVPPVMTLVAGTAVALFLASGSAPAVTEVTGNAAAGAQPVLTPSAPRKALLRERIEGIQIPAGRIFLTSTKADVLACLGQPTSSSVSGREETLRYIGPKGTDSRVVIGPTGVVIAYDSTDRKFKSGAVAPSASPSIAEGASMAQVVARYGTPTVAASTYFMYSNFKKSPYLKVMVVNFDDQGRVKSVMDPLP